MDQPIQHDDVQRALQRCGATWDAAQVHGLLSGRLAIAGIDAGFDWLSQVLEGTDAADALRNECEVILSSLFESTYRRLSERRSEFEPLLPDDEDATETRAKALAHWCEGFLHGLVSSQHNEVLKQKLGEEPLAEIIKDMLQITRAVADGDGDEEADEEAYVELVEYLRVAAQLTFEELAEFRRPVGADDQPEKTPEVRH
jgi:yecA family protein